MGAGAFSGCTKLASFEIPPAVTTISSAMFRNCSELATISIPESVNNIEEYAFQDCSQLKNIHISSLKSWCEINYGYNYTWSHPNFNKSDYTLYLNGKIVEGDLSIPEGVKSISPLAFSNYKKIISLTLPNSLEKIGISAFQNCTELEHVLLSPYLKTIDQYAFDGCDNLYEIELSRSVEECWNCGFENCKSLYSIIVDSANNFYSSIDGILYNKAQTEMICMPPAYTGQHVMPFSASVFPSTIVAGCSALSVPPNANIPYPKLLDKKILSKEK